MKADHVAERITNDTPRRFFDPIPSAVDVAIIGGGVIGVFAALYLARAGKKVIVCEKGRIAGEQSSRNWGWIRQQGRDEAELPIMMRSLELWQVADAESGGVCGFHQGGVCYLASSEPEVSEYDRWLEVAGRHGLESSLMTAAQAKSHFGGHSRRNWIAGLYTPSDARAEPWSAVPAVAALARKSGAMIREDCAARTLDFTAGQVSGVITEAGRIRCEQIILAAGAWSSLFLRRHGIKIPQLTLRGTVARTSPMPEVFSGAACDEELGFRRRQDGGYTLAVADRHSAFIGPDVFRHLRIYRPLIKSDWQNISIHAAQPKHFPDAWTTPRRWSADDITPFERMRVLEPKPSQHQLMLIVDRFQKRFPGIGSPKIITAWAGMIDAMPDVVPIIDRIPDNPELILATGMSAHGFGIGPGYGEVLSKLATGADPGYDLTRFRFSRFSDGSPLNIGPAL